MIFLGPEQTPADRLAALLVSARDASTRPEVHDIVRVVRDRLELDTETALARALLLLVARPQYKGNTAFDGRRGQWLDTDVADVVTRGGDCLDRTHALIALALAAGLDAYPVWLFEESEPLDHVAPRVRSDGEWYWADPLLRPPTLGIAPRGRALRTPLDG